MSIQRIRAVGRIEAAAPASELPEPIAQYLASLNLSASDLKTVVDILVAATPSDETPPAEKQQASAVRGGLQGAELAEFNRAMGIQAAAPMRPHMKGTSLVLPSMTPSQYRAMKARGGR